MSDVKENEKVDLKSVWLSHGQIVFTDLMTSIVTQGVFIGFALKAGLNEFLIGLMAGVGELSVFIQFPVAHWIGQKGHRKRLFAGCLLLSCFSFTMVFLVPLAIQVKVLSIILVLSAFWLYQIFKAAGYTALWPLVRDIYPADAWGRCYGMRNMLSLIPPMIVGPVAGWYLGKAPTWGQFFLVFSIALLSGLIGAICIGMVKDPRERIRDKQRRFHHSFIEPLKTPSFRKMTGIFLVTGFGMGMVTPFYSVYLIEGLQLSYLWITIYQLAIGSFFAALGWKLAGQLGDHIGEHKVFVVSYLTIICSLAVWCAVGPGTMILLGIAYALTGLSTAGIVASSIGLFVKASPPENRAMFTTLTGAGSIIGGSLGMFLGGAFLRWYPAYSLGDLISWNKFQTLFLISAVILTATSPLPFLLPKAHVSKQR